MAQIRFFQGKPLIVGGKVATTNSCCCGGTNTGACCLPEVFGCTEDTTQSDCENAGGIFQGTGSTCTPDPCVGACCNLDTGLCTDDVSAADCEASGGIYLGNQTECSGHDCNCCPILEPFNTITLSGTLTGCGSGSASLGSVGYGRAIAGFGCDLALHEWSKDPNCGCQFQAQCCFPFTETGEVHSDNTGDSCDDPDYGLCSVTAVISCNDRNVQFLAGTPGSAVCCNVADTLTSGFYAIPTSPGTISVSLGGTGGLLTFNINLQFA